MRIKSIDEEYGEVFVTDVCSRGSYNFHICGYSAYMDIFCGKMTIKITSDNIGEKKKIAYILNNFPKRKFIRHLVAARIAHGLSMSDIQEIKKGIEYLRK